MWLLEMNTRSGTTNQMKPADARLLVDNAMHYIKAMQSGAGVLSRFKLIPDLIRLFNTVHEKLSPRNGFHSAFEVSLALFFSLRYSAFCFQITTEYP